MHVIDLRSDVLLRFILFVYSYLCYVELSNRLFCVCGIFVTQNTHFHFVHLLRIIIKFFCILISVLPYLVTQ